MKKLLFVFLACCLVSNCWGDDLCQSRTISRDSVVYNSWSDFNYLYDPDVWRDVNSNFRSDVRSAEIGDRYKGFVYKCGAGACEHGTYVAWLEGSKPVWHGVEQNVPVLFLCTKDSGYKWANMSLVSCSIEQIEEADKIDDVYETNATGNYILKLTKEGNNKFCYTKQEIYDCVKQSGFSWDDSSQTCIKDKTPVERCLESRAGNPEGMACCHLPSSVAKWEDNKCVCQNGGKFVMNTQQTEGRCVTEPQQGCEYSGGSWVPVEN